MRRGDNSKGGIARYKLGVACIRLLYPAFRFDCTVNKWNDNRPLKNSVFDDLVVNYSPLNDSLFAAYVANNLYLSRLGLLPQDSKTRIRAHYGRRLDNAYWTNGYVNLGEGYLFSLSLSDVETVVHEVSHGFTSRFSNLGTRGVGRAVSEAFSDIAAISAEYLLKGKTNFLYGEDAMQHWYFQAARNLKDPSQDGAYVEYKEDLDLTNPYKGIGLLTKPFYVLATTSGWDVMKAFDTYLWANMNCWQPGLTFPDAAQCIAAGASALELPVVDVVRAFSRVGITLPSEHPIADFEHQTTGLTASFIGKSVGSDIVSWDWNFGDGTTSQLQNPDHVYANAIREASVSLKVTNGSGQSNTYVDAISVSDEYCSSVEQDHWNDPKDFWISQFEINERIFSSGNTSYQPAQNEQAPIELILGEKYPLKMKVEGSQHQNGYANVVRIWLDLDGNKKFEGNERRLDNWYSDSFNPELDIPDSANTGTILMRVAYMNQVTMYNPCVDSIDGEIEDYWVRLVE